MANKRKDGLRQASAWVDEEILRKLDELAKAKQQEQGKHFPFRRSDAVRMVLEEHLDAYINNIKRRKDDGLDKNTD